MVDMDVESGIGVEETTTGDVVAVDEEDTLDTLDTLDATVVEVVDTFCAQHPWDNNNNNNINIINKNNNNINNIINIDISYKLHLHHPCCPLQNHPFMKATKELLCAMNQICHFNSTSNLLCYGSNRKEEY
eukprot:m.65948 g.65948  ORF g.65948 m.65948 type:complete len:131 (+) comp8173_c2_seq1:1346-1738(+)